MTSSGIKCSVACPRRFCSSRLGGDSPSPQYPIHVSPNPIPARRVGSNWCVKSRSERKSITQTRANLKAQTTMVQLRRQSETLQSRENAHQGLRFAVVRTPQVPGMEALARETGKPRAGTYLDAAYRGTPRRLSPVRRNPEAFRGKFPRKKGKLAPRFCH